MIEPVESGVWTEINAMDSIAQTTCDTCYTMQLLCHMLSLPGFPLQLHQQRP